MSKIAITGGAGFVGSHTIAKCLKLGLKVICIDNFNDYYNVQSKESNIKAFLSHKNFKLYRTDIVNYNDLEMVFQIEKPNRICHLAARAGVRPSIYAPLLYEEVNIKGTLNLLNLARKYEIENFVFASSSSVYGNNQKIPFSETDNVDYPISPYAATKRACELLAYTYHHLYNLNCTGLRFFTVYGPSGRPDMAPYIFVDSIYNCKEIKRFGDGSSKRDYTYIDDIVEGIVSALEKKYPYEIINLGNNNPIELNYFISLIEKILSKKAIIKEYPKQPGDVDITFADISKAEKLLEYRPKTSIEDGMMKFINWYKDNI